MCTTPKVPDTVVTGTVPRTEGENATRRHRVPVSDAPHSWGMVATRKPLHEPTQPRNGGDHPRAPVKVPFQARKEQR